MYEKGKGKQIEFNGGNFQWFSVMGGGRYPLSRKNPLSSVLRVALKDTFYKFSLDIQNFKYSI